MGVILSKVAAMGVIEEEEEELTILLIGEEYSGRRVAHWLPSSTDSETITMWRIPKS